MSTELRVIDHIPEHPRWCRETTECSDFAPSRAMLAVHLSDPITFNASQDDVSLAVSTARVDTGGFNKGEDEDLQIEVGFTEVRLALRDLAFRCDCGAPREVSVRLTRDDIKQLVNLLTVHDDLALARQLLDIEKHPL